MDSPTETIESEINKRLDRLDRSDGTLILTDLYGGTPSNIASKFAQFNDTRFVSGLNLPMLVKIMNYRNLPLNELTEKILGGGEQSILLHEE